MASSSGISLAWPFEMPLLCAVAAIGGRVVVIADGSTPFIAGASCVSTTVF